MPEAKEGDRGSVSFHKALPGFLDLSAPQGSDDRALIGWVVAAFSPMVAFTRMRSSERLFA